MLAADSLAGIHFFGLLRLIVEVKLVEAVGEGQQDQAVDEEELEDVQQHAAQRDLQRPQVRVGGEEGDEPQGAEDVGDGEHRLRHQGGMPHLPVLPRLTAAVLQGEPESKRSVQSSHNAMLIFNCADIHFPHRFPITWPLKLCFLTKF